MAKEFYTEGTGSNQTLHSSQTEKIPVYDDISAVEADLANLEVGQFVATKDEGITENITDTVQDGNMNAVTSNAVFDYLNPTPITLTAGPHATYFEYTAYKVGKMIFINGGIAGNFDSADVYFTVSNEAKPSSSKRGASTVIILNSGTVPTEFYIDSNGLCQQQQTGGTVTSANFSFAYSV